MKLYKIFFNGKFSFYTKSQDIEKFLRIYESRNPSYVEVTAPEFDRDKNSIWFTFGGYIYFDKKGVSWSALGTVSAEHAEIFALGLIQAIEIQKELAAPGK